MNKVSYKNAVFYYSFSDCAYIDGYDTKFNYASIESCSEEFYNALLERGWRRFGEMFFAPFCDYCKKCISIRQIISDFKLSKNHKRIIKNNSHIKIEIQNPIYDPQKIILYNKYHKIMNIKKGWDYNQIDKSRYIYMFIEGQMSFGKEICYYIDDKLIGVAFVDILNHTKSMSAIYFFYDHDYSYLSLGTFSILKQVEIAKMLDIKYLYPGYWIKDHYSLGYKERFKPFEYLVNRPNIYEEPIWKLYKGEI
ncbi:arginyltransferase [Helicobacter sp. MIT 14-3879]|uniref:arginyltransferase n=1 Tax=Helicobacter sp. MIT 14-3879 TaxID=2040649 RepID=UPI000E1F6B74|nr:arginyltransferase [Helicobacter sp. MIT 14-3879]RDU63491.1 arginyltransferase [Helicobacter sp. MIT 14-3879]